MTEIDEWSMHEITRSTGTTSRTLRHYDQIGLLPPTRIGANGYRYYDTDALVRLQRILLLRELGLSLASIAEVLAGGQSEAEALRTHLELLEIERSQVERRIASVRTTLAKREGGEHLMASEMFDGFDHTQYKDEVTERWGREAWQQGDAWWRSLSAEEKARFQAEQQQIAADFIAAHEAGLDPTGEQVRAIAERHHRWLSHPMMSVTKGYYLGLADMYVVDPRFGKNYERDGGAAAGDRSGAEYVREAMRAYADTAAFDA
ncbi:MerR family transcriptional regulator [Ruania alba]|uniref:DNA-binding transcriptional regulator, MerR family n=1 Tax=Ruania alba TaxID=648782 RepID=A0A1H5L920_9MICO|nr:TipAS antibiotic-recognition domain-containing protein [Ruania alba]SEE72688.1 DNA-binding transcriptional regulator, MerR family [Ruania alba]